MAGYGIIFDINRMDSKGVKSEISDLTIPGWYTQSGSMTSPFSSLAFSILNVASIIEIEIKRELSASLFPGHTLFECVPTLI